MYEFVIIGSEGSGMSEEEEEEDDGGEEEEEEEEKSTWSWNCRS